MLGLLSHIYASSSLYIATSMLTLALIHCNTYASLVTIQWVISSVSHIRRRFQKQLRSRGGEKRAKDKGEQPHYLSKPGVLYDPPT